MKRIVVILMLVALLPISAIRTYASSENGTQASKTLSEAEVLKLCKWYVSTPPSDDAEQTELRGAAAAEILKYAINTEKFSIKIGKAMTKLLDIRGQSHCSTELLGIYTAGEIIYCLEHNLTQSNATSFANSMEGVINIYSQMPEHKLKLLNKYMKMSKEKRLSALEKFYDKENDE